MKLYKLKNPKYHISYYETKSSSPNIYYRDFTLELTKRQFEVINHLQIEYWTKAQRDIKEVLFELVLNEDIEGLRTYFEELNYYI